MPNTTSAKRHLRVSQKRRLRNRLMRSRAYTFVKKTKRLIEAGQLDEARTAAKQATSALDKAAEKGVVHKNTVARKKSRLMKKLHQAQATVDME